MAAEQDADPSQGPAGRQRWAVAGGHVDGRGHDRYPEGRLDRQDGILHEQWVAHRVDRGQLYGLVFDERERRVPRGDEMVSERVANRRAGHGAPLFYQDWVRLKLVAVTVSSCHLTSVICGPG